MQQNSSKLFEGMPVVRFHAMVKPIGPLCNLRCEYCFYLHKKDLIPCDNNWKMSDEVLEKLIRQYIQGQNYKHVVFSWQGGEPTLMGLDFFKRVVELEKKYAPSYMKCENDLQTNGTLLDESWCEFLKENGFRVGISIDGPRDLHNQYRKFANGDGTFNRVMKAIRLLQRYGVEFNTLSCVNNATSKEPLRVYKFLRDDVGSTNMQFSPVVEFRNYKKVAPRFWKEDEYISIDDARVSPEHPNGILTRWSTDGEAYGDFLIKIFDEWYKNDIGKVYLPFFESALQQWLGSVSPLCIFAPICGKAVAVEHNGDTYSCDHCVYKEYYLGNIKNKTLKEMSFSNKQERFGYDKDSTLPKKCRKCKWLFACSGECPKNRCVKTEDGDLGLNYLCKGLYKYFEHIDFPVRTLLTRLGYSADKIDIINPDYKK